MAEQISLDETNRIRKSLGLKPISEASNSEKSHETDATQISVEETNKIRAKLGLKPIPIEKGHQDDNSESQENDNWKKFQDDENKHIEQKKLAKKVKEAKDQAARLKQLQGNTILDDDSTENSDVKSWLKKFREKQKQAAEKRYEEEEDLPKYNEKSIDGLKVGHKMSEIQALNEDSILTLKDQSVLDNEDDELVSSKLQEKDDLKENLANKRGKSKFVHEDQDMDEDEEKKTSFFVLNGNNIPIKKPVEEKESEKGLQSMSIDLDTINQTSISLDYQEPPAKFKKFKPKKFKSTDKKRQRLHDDDENIVPVENDDLDLQNTLAISRKKTLKSKQRRIQTPEEIAEQILKNENVEKESENDGIHVSTTTDFLGFIRKAKNEVNGGTKGPKRTEIKKEKEIPVKEEPDLAIKQEEPDTTVKQELNPIKQELEDQIKLSAVSNQPIKQEQTSTNEPSNSYSISTDENLSIGGGMAEALRLLKDKGAVSTKSDDNEERRKKRAEWHKELERRRLQITADFDKRRDRARQEAGWDRLNAKERSQLISLEKEQLEEELSRASRSLYRDYQPVVNIEYHDEQGNKLNEREAYKELSHQFHGNKSGKRKIEKQIRRREEQLKKESQSIFEDSTPDTSGQKKPGIRLL